MLFFKKKPETDPDDFIQERWTAKFRKIESQRFEIEDGDGYSSAYEGDDFILKLKRANLFGWAGNPWFQYRDFNLEADCSFGAANGYSAMGFCFRQINDANYYYFLVSNRGYFRFDLVFNNTPQVLIPWTRFTSSEKPENSRDIHLRIVARENRFIFLIDEEWVGEADDDSISSGRFAWAGQNYDEAVEADFILHSLTLDSRPLEVEASYYRWGEYVPVDPSLRFRLAESLFLLGAYSPTLIQLKKIRRNKDFSFEENLLAAKSFLGSAFYEEALSSAEKCLKTEPDNIEAIQVAGTALYTLNRLLLLKELLEEKGELLKGFSWYWGLAGNGEYGLGNWDTAVHFYKKAVEFFPEEPLFIENLARAVAKSGGHTQSTSPDVVSDSLSAADAVEEGIVSEDTVSKDIVLDEIPENGAEGVAETPAEFELLSSLEEAAKLYFRQEEYGQVQSLIESICRIDPANPTAAILKGKLLFFEEKWDAAMEVFAPLAEAGDTEDSSVYFLYGLLLGFHDLRELAGRYLEKAAEMEPESFIYQFKAAESLHLRGEDMGPYIENAMILEPEDIWANNLAGLDAQEKGRTDAALEYLSKGWTLYQANRGTESEGSGGVDLLINYSQVLFDAGRSDEALKLLEDHPESEVFNHKGNLLSALGDFPGAVDAYEKAVAGAKENRVYILNCATACIEADFVLRAEELLQLSGEQDAEVINLLGNLARIKGEFARAEAAYLEALKSEPENKVFLLNLAELLHQRGNHAEALALIEKIPEDANTRRGKRLYTSVKNAMEQHLECSSCGHEWILPRDISDQGGLKLHGEIPDDAPAGRCPSCGKLYCVSCAGHPDTDGRFICSECDEKLLINEKKILYILRKRLGFSAEK
ncbi:MAG: tetratricopeptide repeat protein [Spirochaetales bacterium]|nr:tetratricopeptide repeat protein [Spirochaetales bacterium]